MKLKQIVVASLVAIALSGQITAKNYDAAALKRLVQETADAFEAITQSLESTRSGYGDKIKEYTKALFNAQKEVIKDIKARLKAEYKSLKSSSDRSSYAEKKELYRAYKDKVYRTWRATQELPTV